jgi:hypothetical protein
MSDDIKVNITVRAFLWIYLARIAKKFGLINVWRKCLIQAKKHDTTIRKQIWQAKGRG